MPPPLRSRDEVVALLFEVFRREGYDGGTLADLAAATGLGKSSLYHYFPDGKVGMARAVLAQLGEALRQEVVAPLRRAGPLQARLSRSLAALERLYQGGKKACLLERLCASAAREPLQRELRAAFGDWIDALAELLLEAGVAPARARHRAEDAVIRVEGALVLCAGRDEVGPFRRTLRDLQRSLLTDGP